MMIKFRTSAILVLATVLAAANAEYNLRGNVGAEDFSCSVAGAAGSDVCDSSKSSDVSRGNLKNEVGKPAAMWPSHHFYFVFL